MNKAMVLQGEKLNWYSECSESYKKYQLLSDSVNLEYSESPEKGHQFSNVKSECKNESN